MNASPRSRRLAEVRDRDLVRLEREGMREARRVALRLRVAVLRSLDRDNPATVVRQQMANLRQTVLRGLIAAHLAGRYRQMIDTLPVMRKAITAAAYDDAISFLARRLELNDADLDVIARIYGDEATRVVDELGDFASRKVQEALVRTTTQGLHLRAGIAEVRNALDAAGVTVQSPHLIETTFRTQTALAYSAGEANAFEDPALDEILWGYEYVTVGDDRVRPEHAALDGFRAAKDDPIWQTHTPPNGFNCRCRRVPIFVGDELAVPQAPPGETVMKVGAGEATIRPGPDAGWEFNPGHVFRDLIAA